MSSRAFAGMAVLAAFLAGDHSARAHHATSMFDMSSVIEIQGVVTEFHYVNPHARLFVMQTTDDGTQTRWMFEADSPAILSRAGIDRDTFTPGADITVRGHPMRDGSPSAFWIDATLPDGAVITSRVRPGNR